MKVLLANWVYNWGSTGFIVRVLYDRLTSMGHQVIVAVAVNHDNDNPNVHIITKPSEWMLFWRLHRLGLSPFRGSTSANHRLVQIIEKEKPDIVNVHLLHGNRIHFYKLLQYLGESHVKTVVTNHAEMYYTGNCEHAYDCTQWIDSQCRRCPDVRSASGAYWGGNTHRNWVLMQKAFGYFDTSNILFTAVSPWVKERFLQSPITNRFACEVVLNGLDTDIFRPIGEEEQITGRLEDTAGYLLHVTANFNPLDTKDVKGGHYLIKLAEALPNQKFVVVATNVGNIASLPNNILVYGKAKDQKELARIYSRARITVLVSRRETFSMVTAESLSCGTPVVGFLAGGPESIALSKYSMFVEQGDIQGLVCAINEMLSRKIDRITISKEAHEIYGSETMAKGYLSAYERILNR